LCAGDVSGSRSSTALGPFPSGHRIQIGVELERVERERWTKPTRETFATFVEEWRRVYLPSRNLKRSTLVDYANTLDRHALPYFGSMALDAIGPEHLDKYIGAKLADGYRQRR
jgi:integrase-like protein